MEEQANSVTLDEFRHHIFTSSTGNAFRANWEHSTTSQKKWEKLPKRNRLLQCNSTKNRRYPQIFAAIAAIVEKIATLLSPV